MSIPKQATRWYLVMVFCVLLSFFAFAVGPVIGYPRETIEHVHDGGRHIPRADAKWMGELLSRLSPDQIRDAFRAAGYSPQEAQEFAAIVQSRIAELDML